MVNTLTSWYHLQTPLRRGNSWSATLVRCGLWCSHPVDVNEVIQRSGKTMYPMLGNTFKDLGIKSSFKIVLSIWLKKSLSNTASDSHRVDNISPNIPGWLKIFLLYTILKWLAVAHQNYKTKYNTTLPGFQVEVLATLYRASVEQLRK